MPSAQGHITIRRKAKDGESAVRLDLDNEHEEFIYDDEGVRLSGHVTSQARLYDGSVEVTHGVTWSIDLDGTHGTAIGNEGIAVTDSSADMALEEIFYSRNCCWIKTDGTLHVNGISSDMASIKVKAMYKGNAYYADFVAKRRKRDKYELVVTPHSLPYNTSRAWAGKTVGISVNRTSFDGTRREGISLGNLDIDNALFVVAKYRTSGQQNASWHEIVIDETGRRCTQSVTSGMVSNNEEILIELRKADINEYDEEDAGTYTVEDYETIPIIKAADGERGLESCILRVSEWAEGVEYHNDEALTSGTRYLDIAVVTKGPNTFDAYKCKQTHTSSDSILVSNTTYWQKFNQLLPVYTPLILAQNALLRFTQTNQLLVMKSDGTTVAAGMGGGKGAGDECNYPLWVGGTTPDTAPFKVRIDGILSAVGAKLNDAEISGVLRANLGFGSSLDMANLEYENGYHSIVPEDDLCSLYYAKEVRADNDARFLKLPNPANYEGLTLQFFIATTSGGWDYSYYFLWSDANWLYAKDFNYYNIQQNVVVENMARPYRMYTSAGTNHLFTNTLYEFRVIGGKWYHIRGLWTGE